METVKTAAKPPLEDWLPLLITSVREVFETMVGARPVPSPEPSTKMRLDWTAMVGLAGQLCGVVTFSCDERSAMQLASGMLGIALEQPDDRAGDAVGEICNMIAGNFKHKINGLSDGCLLSPPTVVTGTDYRVHRQASKAVHTLHVTFVFEGAPVHVSLEVRQ